jgi:hypothetical protein
MQLGAVWRQWNARGGTACKAVAEVTDVPEWQELAGDRLGWRKMLKSIKIRTQLVLLVGRYTG